MCGREGVVILKKTCIAMLLAGGQGSRLYALTAKVAKPGMPFGGKYRIIDFPLSNCANSGIDTVGVLTQYQPLQLNRYVGSGQPWDLDTTDGGVYILPPYQSAGERGSWFSGTANAIYQNIDFIEMYDPDHVLILSGDHVYKMDYADMLRKHREAEAACTIAVIQVSMEEATRFGIMNVGEDGFINEFEEKPAHPKSDLASMGIYIFDWKKLRQALIDDENDPNSSKDFGKNIIPNMLAAGEKLLPYRFEGYWRDVGTITSLWDANMDMLSTTSLNLFDPQWPIRARSPIRPPHYVGEDGRIVHSIVTEGCDIDGKVENSVLSHSVKVGAGAKISYSVIMPGAVIEPGAVVEYAIVGENAHIGAGAHVGAEPDGSENWGVATIGPEVHVGAGVAVPPSAMIYDSSEVQS